MNLRRAFGGAIICLTVVGAACLLISMACPAAGQTTGDASSGALQVDADQIRGSRDQGFLVRAATDPRPFVRQAAVLTIGYRIKEPTAATRAAIRKALDDPHPLVVYSALNALTSLPDAKASAAVLRIVKIPPVVGDEHRIGAAIYGHHTTSSEELRVEGIRVLKAIGSPDAVPALLAVLGVDSAAARGAAAQALATCGAASQGNQRQAITDKLATLLTDFGGEVREDAAATLAYLGDGRGTGVLFHQISHPSGNRLSRHTAAAALKQLTGQANWETSYKFWDYDRNEHPDKIQRHTEVIRAKLIEMGFSVEPEKVASKSLSPEDIKLLEKLYTLGLFDPGDRKRVKCKVAIRSCWGSQWPADVSGWLVPKTANRPALLVLDNLHEVDAPAKFSPVDFGTEVASAVAEAQNSGKLPRPFLPSGHIITTHNMTMKYVFWAAWLMRRGDQATAARLLFLAKADYDGREAIIEQAVTELAWQEFNQGLLAYMFGADEQAQRHLERLRQEYGDHLDRFGDGTGLLAELQRREKAGRLGMAETTPQDFNGWPVDKRVAWLILELENARAPQWGQPGGVVFGTDKWVQMLIKIGDPAVPGLLDCLEHDRRLTRSVSFWRDFAASRTVLPVSGAARAALNGILREESLRGASVERLRRYWASSGRIPFDERMVAVLVSPESSREDVCEAAWNLATIDDPVGRFGFGVPMRAAQKRAPNPLIKKYSDPTVAELILEAADRFAKSGDVVTRIARSIVRLDDLRIVPALKKRFVASTECQQRRLWANACFRLGDGEPMNQFAADFREGKSYVNRVSSEELRRTIRCLAEANTSPCNEALDALGRTKHPNYGPAFTGIREAHIWYAREDEWFAHRFCLAILRGLLDDLSPTGTICSVRDGQLIEEYDNGYSSRDVPSYLSGGQALRRDVLERRADRAAMLLNQHAMGLPVNHVLFEDADARLARTRAILDRYAGRMIPLSQQEKASLGLDPDVAYRPPIQPLGRPATAEDVRQGGAIFHLEGKGQLADVTLPATGRLKRDLKKSVAMGRSAFTDMENAPHVLIVQAERDADGTLYYGIIGQFEISKIAADEFSEVVPLAQPKDPVPAPGQP